MAEDNKNLEWDAPITADGSKEFERPPMGDYKFEVCGLEKTTSKTGSNMAVVELKLLDGDQAGFRMKDNLVLISSMEWKLAQFFECLGMKKKGEPLKKMPWNDVLGQQGMLKLTHEEYNGKTYCKVKRYLEQTAENIDMPFEI